MSTATTTAPETTSTGTDEEVDHPFCGVCNPGPPPPVAACGADIEGEAECPEDCDHPECPMCVYLDQFPCPDCGAES